MTDTLEKRAREIHIVFDGPPGHTAGRFVECEDEHGRGIKIGRWEQRGNFWHLVLEDPRTTRNEALDEAAGVFGECGCSGPGENPVWRCHACAILALKGES